MELNFTVTNQKIKYVSNLYIVEKSKNYLTAKFSFSGSEWKNVEKTAIFKKDDLAFNVLLDENGKCIVPWEVITRGTLKVSVFGGDLITVDTADVKILKSGYEEGNVPSEPTPDVYSQILKELHEVKTEFVTEEELGNAIEAWLADNVVEALSPEDVEKIVFDYLDEHKDEIKGEKGTTFTPHVENNVLSWTNDGGFENPQPISFNDITTTTSTTFDAYAGRLNILEIGGVTEQGENPSPSNPQEIKKTVISEIMTHGKNLFNGNQASGAYMQNGSWFEVNTRLSTDLIALPSANINISLQSTATNLAILNVHYFNASKAWIGDISTLGIASLDADCRTFALSLPNNAKYISVTFAGYKDRTKVIESYSLANEKLQVEKGAVSTEYEPYMGESSITLSQPIELFSGDTLTPQNVVKKFGVVVFDGSADEKWYLNTSNIPFVETTLPGKSTKTTNGFCTHFTHTTIYSNTQTVGYSLDGTEMGIRIRPSDYATLTLDEWNARLASSPMTVVYELTTPTTEELPIVDQIALNSLQTFDGTTYVEFDAEIQPTFKAEHGTSKVGGYTLESLLTARNNDLRLSAVESTVVNNI